MHTVTVDTGGFSPEELDRIHALAGQLGAASHTTLDARSELFDGYLRHLIAGNVLRGGLYPLSVSAERVCQAKRVVAHARTMGATALAHGSTGAGNDQVRFDVAFRALAPDLALHGAHPRTGPEPGRGAGLPGGAGLRVPAKSWSPTASTKACGAPAWAARRPWIPGSTCRPWPTPAARWTPPPRPAPW